MAQDRQPAPENPMTVEMLIKELEKYPGMAVMITETDYRLVPVQLVEFVEYQPTNTPGAGYVWIQP